MCREKTVEQISGDDIFSGSFRLNGQKGDAPMSEGPTLSHESSFCLVRVDTTVLPSDDEDEDYSGARDSDGSMVGWHWSRNNNDNKVRPKCRVAVERMQDGEISRLARKRQGERDGADLFPV